MASLSVAPSSAAAALKKKKDSVDSKHFNQLRQFQQKATTVSKIKEEIAQKQKMLNKLKEADPIFLSQDELDILAQLVIEIPNLMEKLDKVENVDSLCKYYMETGVSLSKYYQILTDKDKDLRSFKETIENSNPRENKFNAICQLYDSITDPLNNYAGKIETEKGNVCEICKTKKEVLYSEGITVCPVCYDSESTVIHSDKPAYNDSSCDNIYFSYKRINHFKEKLNSVQQEYNFKLPHIIEDRLCEMFLKIQKPFIKYRPMDQNNFTSYAYVIHKCLIILGYADYAKHFTLLKSRDKLYAAEVTWKKICQELGWTFYPSNL